MTEEIKTAEASISSKTGENGGLDSGQGEKPVRNPYADAGKKKKSRFSKKQKQIFYISAALLFVLSSVLFVRQLINRGKGGEGEIQTGTVMRGRLESFITGWGAVVPKEQETLGSEIKGEITKINVKAGDSVKKGDAIFAIDDELMRDDLDAAKAEFDEVEDMYRQVNEGITNLKLRAPYKGKLLGLQTTVKVGQDISSGTAVGTYVDDSVMRLGLYFSYGFADRIKAGMDAMVSVPASMSTVAGKVESVQLVKKISDEGAVLFKVFVKLNNPGALKKDMTATAVIKSPDGDIMPAESGKLEYIKEETLLFESSGEVISTDIYEFKEYDEGQIMCVLKSDKDPEKQLFDAERRLSEARKKVEQSEKALAQSTVTSPIDGIVTSVLKEVGDEIENYGTDVVVISNLSKMIVEINIDEMDISKVSIGLPVMISYDKTDGTNSISGEISSVSFEAKSEQGGRGGGVSYFPAKILITNPGDLMPGVGVNYRISAFVKEDCLMVPSAAVTYTEEGTAVFVKTVDGRKIEKPAKVDKEKVPKGYEAALVEIGLADEQNTEIISGLMEGDTVVLIGQVNQGPMGVMGREVKMKG